MQKNILLELFFQTEDEFFRAMSVACLELGDGITAYKTGVDYQGLNFLSIKKNPGTINVNKTLVSSEDFFHLENTPFCVCTSEKLSKAKVGAALNKQGYQQNGMTTAMAIELTQTLPLDDSVVPMDDKLSDWVAPLMGAFYITPHIAAQYVQAHQRAMQQHETMHHYSQYDSGQVVSSFTLTVNQQLARIDDMGTLPAFERKGYATRLLMHALAKARALGARYCFLSSSNVALPVYSKMGFQSLARQHGYSYVG